MVGQTCSSHEFVAIFVTGRYFENLDVLLRNRMHLLGCIAFEIETPDNIVLLLPLFLPRKADPIGRRLRHVAWSFGEGRHMTLSEEM